MSRGNIALLIAWYGALRFQAAVHKIGSFETPGPLVETTPPTSTAEQLANHQESAFVVLELEDITHRSLS